MPTLLSPWLMGHEPNLSTSHALHMSTSRAWLAGLHIPMGVYRSPWHLQLLSAFTHPSMETSACISWNFLEAVA